MMMCYKVLFFLKHGFCWDRIYLEAAKDDGVKCNPAKDMVSAGKESPLVDKKMESLEVAV